MNKRVTVDLADDEARAIEAAVVDGRFASEAEAVRAAVAAWAANEADEVELREADIQRLRRMVEEGLASGPSLDADAVLSRLRERIAIRTSGR
ncbi:type II toxin-antitoxin system ParD family antitoxin [Prosthecodimorpha staleyi]|uniref:Type II toxin-antitoxin system ParD family antitoxin n=1 Tax=Prosthecodimorpha staleyi TaxID=2840188 RepID=A0A947D6I4_9HYPH|nr:type II toxin-antitoxin system ParD family antitoxin [Prosthecodimorpha staleyi]MBT9291248.1 type II toxin-antitoxin system ParD family antitoxin [Prosthecodimorpha staleyi]